MTDIFDLRVQFFADWSAEPTLRELVEGYYKEHLKEDEAKECANEYIMAMRAAMAGAFTVPQKDSQQ